MVKLQINSLRVAYSRLFRRPILNLSSLNIESGQVVAILGPNHIGKSTLLKTLAGAERDLHISKDSSVLYNDKSLADFGRTNISYLPQRFRETLFPWMSLGDNLRIRLIANSIQDRVDEQVLQLCNCFGFDSEEALFSHFGFSENGIVKRPTQLSGGQQQTLTLLRTLLPTPKMIVMDEPFSAIDIYKGAKLRRDFLEFVETKAITTLFVTHDLEEAVDLADKIVVLRGDDSGSDFSNLYDVGQQRSGPNLGQEEATQLIERIKRENGMG
jgi:ABC-type nitrate/sulfonate/bicarbonate transport system ATPase subunit